MMVPSNRLLAWMALVFVPCAGLAASLPAARLPAGAVAGGLAAIVAADALRSRRRLAGLVVQAPGVLRLSKDRAGVLPLVVRQGQSPLAGITLGLGFPGGFTTPHGQLAVALPAGHAAARVDWPCTSAQRGVFQIARCHVEAPSALGFWQVRAARPLGAEIRVHPSLLAERKAVPALFLSRGRFGVRPQHQIGKGKAFEKLREYQPGDSYEDIHWKATARRGHPITKMFQIERTQEVYVAIDASRLSGRPAGAGETGNILERYLNAGLILGRAAERQGDHFGLLTFSDRLSGFVRARHGAAHYRACIEAMCRLQAEDVTPDFNEVCAFIRTRLRKRALIVFLTQLDDPLLAEHFLRNVELIRRNHLVVVCQLMSPGVRPVFEAAEEVAALDDIYRAVGGHLRWQSLRELQAALRQRGVTLFHESREKLAAHLVTQYINIKQRQFL